MFAYELDGEYEKALANLYFMSVSEGFEIHFDFRIIEEFSDRCGWDSIETLMIIREITAKVKAK